MIDCLDLIKNYVKFPSVSADPSCEKGMKDSRDYIANVLKEIGFDVEIVPTNLHAVVFAERRVSAKNPTVMFYGHYDVQPADPFELWETPPFEPTIRNNRIYGRGTADNKGPHSIIITALAQVLEENPHLPLNILVVLEGEEEIGSVSFLGFLKKYKERLQSDLVILSDTMSRNSDQIIITTGLRGLMGLEVVVKGANTDLHSGLYGGPIVNPIQALTKICASLHTNEGKVNIQGFYDEVLSPIDWEQSELNKISADEEKIKKLFNISNFRTYDNFKPFELIRFLPTLEFNGITGGYQGKGIKTIIPSYASLKITCRLVPNQDPIKIQQLVIDAIRKNSSKEVTIEFELGQTNAPYWVSPPHKNIHPKQATFLSNAFASAELAIEKHFHRKPLYLRDGGSIGIITHIKEVLNVDSLMIGLSLPEDNLHAPNESLSMDMITKGVSAYKDLILSL